MRRPVRLLPLCALFWFVPQLHALAPATRESGARFVPGIAPGAAADTGAVYFRVRLRSASGGVPAGLDISLQDAEGSDIQLTADSDRAGTYHALLRGGIAYELDARAVGHRPASFAFEVEEGRPFSRDVVLEVNPVVLPALEAIARWEGERGAGARSVSSVRLDEAPIRWRGLADWLTTLPGLAIRGGSGRGTALSVRGSRPEGVLVLLDGHPINDPISGRADLESVSVGSLSSASLIRGAASARYGAGALAGVLLLRSRAPASSSASAALYASSFGGVGGDLQLARDGKLGRASLSVAWRSARNDFEYENRLLPGSPLERRQNADATSVSVASGVSRGRFHVGVRYDGAKRGMPGPMGNEQFRAARWSEHRALASLDWQGRWTGVSGRFGWFGSAWTPGAEGPQSVRDAWHAGVGAQGRTGGASALELGGRVSVESLAGDGIQESARRVLAGISIARPLELGAVRVDPAVSLDGTGKAWAMSPEVSASMSAGRSVTVRARIGQAFRLPTLGDLYFRPGLQVRADPNLDPERVTLDTELGIDVSWMEGEVGVETSVTGWYRTTEDPIVWLASSAAVWSPRNLDQLVSLGLEAVVRTSWRSPAGGVWNLVASGTLDRSRLGFGPNRNPAPYRPASLVAVSVERASRALAVLGRVRWTGSRSTSIAATRALPGFAILDLAVAYGLPFDGVPLEAEFRLDNLLDRRYELVELYPEPGRRFSLTLRLR